MLLYSPFLFLGYCLLYGDLGVLSGAGVWVRPGVCEYFESVSLGGQGPPFVIIGSF